MATESISIYEQPLNERIRAFLRLEMLFQRAAFNLAGDTVWDSRASLESINDILALLNRADLRTEIIKELDRHAGTLEGLSRNPVVDHDRLNQILSRLQDYLHQLRSHEHPPGHDLRNHELIAGLRQRNSIPAGSCSFDLPAFHHWLEREPEQRQAELRGWLDQFSLIRDSVALCLQVVRDSAGATDEVAESGFFQRNVDSNQTCQLIRVAIPRDAPWYPEISGGRHRFSIRFLVQKSSASRPSQSDAEVAFQLLCCMI